MTLSHVYRTPNCGDVGRMKPEDRVEFRRRRNRRIGGLPERLCAGPDYWHANLLEGNAIHHKMMASLLRGSSSSDWRRGTRQTDPWCDGVGARSFIRSKKIRAPRSFVVGWSDHEDCSPAVRSGTLTFLRATPSRPCCVTISAVERVDHRCSSSWSLRDWRPSGSRCGYSEIRARLALMTARAARRSFSAAEQTWLGPSLRLTAPWSRAIRLSKRSSLRPGSECLETDQPMTPTPVISSPSWDRGVSAPTRARTTSAVRSSGVRGINRP